MSKKEITEIAEGWVEYTFPDPFTKIDYSVVDDVFQEVVRILNQKQVKK